MHDFWYIGICVCFCYIFFIWFCHCDQSVLAVACSVREVLIRRTTAKEREKHWKTDDEKASLWFGIIFINGWAFCGVFGTFHWVTRSTSGGVVQRCLSGPSLASACHYSRFEVCAIIHSMASLIKPFYKTTLYYQM